MKPRNYQLAWIAQNDPARLRTRTVETETRKLSKIRARRKDAWRKEVRQDRP